jgi:glycosyltransferase involved in cell wall biosynthesis
MLKVIFSNGLFGKAGPGFVLQQIYDALEKAGLLDKHICCNIKNPAEYDIEATKEIEKCDVFIGGLGSSYHQMRKAKKLGAKTLLLRFSTHHLHQQQVLQGIYTQYHMQVFPTGVNTAFKEYQLADYFLVLSEYCKYTYILNGISQEQVFVVSPGMDIEKFTFAEPHEDPFRVLFVGTNPIRKGLPYLLNAWEELVAEGLKGELVVRSDVSRLPVKNAVSVPQWVSEDELVDLYHHCSVTVLPSLEEGFAASNLESMACGRPIIATNVTGAEDAITDYKEGILIPPCDVKAIKEAILYFYNARSALVSMGANARLTAEKYTWERFRSNVAKIVEGLLVK